MYHTIQQIVDKIKFDEISNERKLTLSLIADYVRRKVDNGEIAQLNFICTHNSRRSQFAQLWAQVAARNYNVKIATFSGGVEVTEFNQKALDSLNRFGFRISAEGSLNKKYTLEFNAGDPPMLMYSKLIEDSVNPKDYFLAVMTCSDADEKCPFVMGCETRIALPFEDPKYYDGSPIEAAMYDYRSFQIATELFYAFSLIHS